MRKGPTGRRDRAKPLKGQRKMPLVRYVWYPGMEARHQFPMVSNPGNPCAGFKWDKRMWLVDFVPKHAREEAACSHSCTLAPINPKLHHSTMRAPSSTVVAHLLAAFLSSRSVLATNSIQLSDDLLLNYQINVPSDTTYEICDMCTISIEAIYDGEAWVGIGFSTDGVMVGSEAVV